MKSQTFRAFVLLALIAIAHQIKPFTTTNVMAFAGASLGSLTELLPESALRKASVLAAVVSRAWQNPVWQNNDALALPAANLLAVNKATEPSACEGKTKRRARAALPVRVAAVPESETEEVESADEPVIGWQNSATEETPASEKMELPRSTELPHAAAAPAWSTIMPKRDACEIPSTTDVAPNPESLPETKPTNESETEAPAKPMRSGRPLRSSEIEPVEIETVEIRAIVYPRASATPSRLLYLPLHLKAAPKSASKC